MADLINVSVRDLLPGKWTLNEASLLVGEDSITFGATRDGWPDTDDDVIECYIDISLDNGQTWLERYAGFTASGGISIGRDGEPIGESVMTVGLPKNGGKKIRVRGEVNFIVPLRSEVKVRSAKKKRVIRTK